MRAKNPRQLSVLSDTRDYNTENLIGKASNSKNINYPNDANYLWPSALIEGLAPPDRCPLRGFVRYFRSIQHSWKCQNAAVHDCNIRHRLVHVSLLCGDCEYKFQLPWTPALLLSFHQGYKKLLSVKWRPTSLCYHPPLSSHLPPRSFGFHRCPHRCPRLGARHVQNRLMIHRRNFFCVNPRNSRQKNPFPSCQLPFNHDLFFPSSKIQFEKRSS